MQLPYWRRAFLIYFLWTSNYMWGAGAPFADRARISTACGLSEDCPNELLQRGICEGFAGLRTLARYGDSRSLAYIGSAISRKGDCTKYCLTASRANANRRRAILWRIGGGSPVKAPSSRNELTQRHQNYTRCCHLSGGSQCILWLSLPIMLYFVRWLSRRLHHALLNNPRAATLIPE